MDVGESSILLTVILRLSLLKPFPRTRYYNYNLQVLSLNEHPIMKLIFELQGRRQGCLESVLGEKALACANNLLSNTTSGTHQQLLSASPTFPSGKPLSPFPLWKTVFFFPLWTGVCQRSFLGCCLSFSVDLRDLRLECRANRTFYLPKGVVSYTRGLGYTVWCLPSVV